MKNRIVLALALVCVSLPIAAPSARACGGYVHEAPEVRDVRVVLQERLSAWYPHHSVYVREVRFDGDRARAAIAIRDHESGTEVSLSASLRSRDGTWRIVSVG